MAGAVFKVKEDRHEFIESVEYDSEIEYMIIDDP